MKTRLSLRSLLANALLMAILVLICAPVYAQWVKVPAPAIPRVPDGKPKRANRWIPDMEHRRRPASRPPGTHDSLWLSYQYLDEYMYLHSLSPAELEALPLREDVQRYKDTDGAPKPIHLRDSDGTSTGSLFQCNETRHFHDLGSLPKRIHLGMSPGLKTVVFLMAHQLTNS